MTLRDNLGNTSGKVARSVFAALLSVLGFAALPAICTAQHSGGHPHGPQARAPYQGAQPYPQARPPFEGGPGNGGRPQYPGGQQQHLGAWLQQHGNMSLPEQEKALRKEPGFNRLSTPAQQKVMESLARIDSMPPAQRQRTLGRIEAMEHLSPEKRQQVRASFQELRTLPADRQRMVKKAFRDLREYPAEQRDAMMSTPQFESQFSSQERGILSNVLAVEPYQPQTGPPQNTLQYGK